MNKNTNTGEMEFKDLPKDIINTLPSILIENILCRVQLRDAVRTSILSKNWRYKWASIPKLVFKAESMFEWENWESFPGNREVFYAIHQVLLLHQGPILEFSLSIRADKTCVEIDQIILHLSRKNTVKKLTLELLSDCGSAYKLPFSIFSLNQLTDLSLDCCDFDFNITTFSGFGCLTSLSLCLVRTSRETLVHLISNCPLLAELSLVFLQSGNHDSITLDVIELVNCLPAVEFLYVTCCNIECFAPQDLPTRLVHLKVLFMQGMQFVCKSQLCALFHLIRSSPNLEKIKIIPGESWITNEVNSLDDFSNIWLEHLKELEISYFTYSKLEMEFVKLILAKSPMLKKMRVVLGPWVENEEELKILEILLRYPRESLTEIIVECPRDENWNELAL